MEYFVGLDVSLEATAVCVVDGEGKTIRESMVGTDPDALAGFLTALNLPLKRIGLEAGSMTHWLYHSLNAAGLPVICIETRHAKAALKAQMVKTDRNDARGLAQIMRTGWYKAVHVKGAECQKLRVLLGNRRFLVDGRVRIENQIRGTLKTFGLKTGAVTRVAYERRIRELMEGHDELCRYVEPLLAVRRQIMAEAARLEKAILDFVKNDEACRLFMTVPGVGPLTALAFRSAIETPHRFRKSRHVGAHLGLTPRKYASGEVDYDGGITRCGDEMVRSHLFEAAKVLLSRVSKWSALKAWGMQIARRSGMKNACVAVARKLAVILHRMWLDGTEFRYGSMPVAAAA